MADNPMKVRIGVSLGAAGVPAQFSAAVDALERAGVDSLWLPEMVYGSLVDPFIGMTYALARTSRLKVGTGVAVLPGRHPVLVAKQLATLAGLAPRRGLPVFGLKPARPAELAAFPVPPGRPAAGFDERNTVCASNAQTFRGSIQGTITDSTGAAIPGAQVKVFSPGTGLNRTVSTNELGG